MTVRRDRMRRTLGILAVMLLAAGLLGQIPSPAALAANPNVGFADFEVGSAAGSAPNAGKPQSQLWWNDGAWWSVVFNLGDNTYHIYRLTWPDQWVDTGTPVDNRPLAHS